MWFLFFKKNLFEKNKLTNIEKYIIINDRIRIEEYFVMHFLICLITIIKCTVIFLAVGILFYQ